MSCYSVVVVLDDVDDAGIDAVVVLTAACWLASADE